MKKKKRGVSKNQLKVLLKKIKQNKSKSLLVFLIILNLLLVGLSIVQAKGLLIPDQPDIGLNHGSLHLSHFNLEQKIAQMTIALGIEYFSDAFKNMQIGGVHIHTKADEEGFRRTVNNFQENTTIPMFITADVEGCINPFAHFKPFKSAWEIKTLGQAFEKGKEEGKYMKSLGFNVNFAPIVDLNDTIWNCRTFFGDVETISELANAYILGLEDEGVVATAKHYPGKTLVIRDPHKYLAAAEITEDDLYPYHHLINKDTVRAIMISHLITFGEVNSEGKPSVASEKIVQGLRDDGFDGLIITDEINMMGVSKFYDTRDEMYIDIFKAGPDLVLNFYQDPNEIYHMIQVVKKAVKDGIISEDRIDASVKRILEAKGFNVMYE